MSLDFLEALRRADTVKPVVGHQALAIDDNIVVTDNNVPISDDEYYPILYPTQYRVVDVSGEANKRFNTYTSWSRYKHLRPFLDRIVVQKDDLARMGLSIDAGGSTSGNLFGSDHVIIGKVLRYIVDLPNAPLPELVLESLNKIKHNASSTSSSPRQLSSFTFHNKNKMTADNLAKFDTIQKNPIVSALASALHRHLHNDAPRVIPLLTSMMRGLARQLVLQDAIKIYFSGSSFRQ